MFLYNFHLRRNARTVLLSVFKFLLAIYLVCVEQKKFDAVTLKEKQILVLKQIVHDKWTDTFQNAS
jgi:hypothetical protein